ncbi:hypothetical protein V8G54_026322 [Vigna mungo]|uniref:Uncharacterized protein n=1 Tax=Vigna mungo TaxID=3915 RepID=A0AAQ3N084_VIGMU
MQEPFFPIRIHIAQGGEISFLLLRLDSFVIERPNFGASLRVSIKPKRVFSFTSLRRRLPSSSCSDSSCFKSCFQPILGFFVSCGQPTWTDYQWRDEDTMKARRRHDGCAIETRRRHGGDVTKTWQGRKNAVVVLVVVLLLSVLIRSEGGSFLPSLFSDFNWVVFCLIDSL